ncbi:WbqC family protein [Pseudanabaena sp. 'Roaring Creek']|uniref:WbqC family protein n=1 Tax=Pseudanabaena sp. 'Roaring Creek' TaxID=1681830 RepID=UPI0006D82AD9|nr:WbqC family protein [Pseudanabaena sp. 'Roaring Creek']
MKVGIIQSNYIPWRGYFDFIDSVDLFIVFDDIQYPMGRSWRNRNQLKTDSGLHWLTVPVQSKPYQLDIDQVLISSPNQSWQTKHRILIERSLKAANFFHDVVCLWESAISVDDIKLSDLNVRLIKSICSYLNITTPIVMARDYSATANKTERILQLLKKVNATSYLSGQIAKDYLDENLFRENGIGLEYKSYDYLPYPQLWGDFIGNVSILDLIANVGKEAKSFLTSQSPNIIAVKATTT